MKYKSIKGTKKSDTAKNVNKMFRNAEGSKTGKKGKKSETAKNINKIFRKAEKSKTGKNIQKMFDD